jgi:hypothetical protein
VNELRDTRPGFECTRKTDEWPTEQRCVPRLVQTEQSTQLRIEMAVGKTVGGELIFEEVAEHTLGEENGIQHRRLRSKFANVRKNIRLAFVRIRDG